METEKQAQKIRDRYSKILGENWKPEIWENLGWHLCWNNGSMSLSYHSYGSKFSCLVGAPKSGTGHLDFSDVYGSSDDPVKSIRAALKNAKKIIKNEWMPIVHSLNEIEKQLK